MIQHIEAEQIVGRSPNIDGIEKDGQGNYLVSQWEGKLYRVSRSGEARRILDTTMPEINCANFEYARELGLIIVPTYFNNRITAYDLVE